MPRVHADMASAMPASVHVARIMTCAHARLVPFVHFAMTLATPPVHEAMPRAMPTFRATMNHAMPAFAGI